MANGSIWMFYEPLEGGSPTRLQQIVRPTRVPFFWEQSWWDMIAIYPAYTPPLMYLATLRDFNVDIPLRYTAGRHFRSSSWGYNNTVFADGHVRPRVSMRSLESWVDGKYYFGYLFNLAYGNNINVLPPGSEFHTNPSW